MTLKSSNKARPLPPTLINFFDRQERESFEFYHRLLSLSPYGVPYLPIAFESVTSAYSQRVFSSIFSFLGATSPSCGHKSDDDDQAEGDTADDEEESRGKHRNQCHHRSNPEYASLAALQGPRKRLSTSCRGVISNWNDVSQAINNSSAFPACFANSAINRIPSNPSHSPVPTTTTKATQKGLTVKK